MLLLAIESATLEVGAAVVSEEGLVAAATARPGRRHAETLHPLIAETAARAGLPLAALDAIAVDVGPGLFTGLRVGIAAAKSLAFALGLELVGLYSTEVLAHAVRYFAGPVVPVVDLRRGELAWSLPGAVPEPPVRGSVERLAGELARLDGAALLVGDGSRRYRGELGRLAEEQGAPAPTIAGDELAAPPVTALAELGLARLKAGLAGSPFAVEPCYLREAEVRIGWVTRDGERAGGGRGAPERAGSSLAAWRR